MSGEANRSRDDAIKKIVCFTHRSPKKGGGRKGILALSVSSLRGGAWGSGPWIGWFVLTGE